MTGRREPVLDRLVKYIDIDVSGCWLWTGAIQGGRAPGYGRLNVERQPKLAHRVSYEELVEPIPEGLQLDHLCRVRRCVNPDHLEPVTQQENLLRSPIQLATLNALKTHCSKGHEYTPENTRIYVGKHRHQRICRKCEKARHGGKS